MKFLPARTPSRPTHLNTVISCKVIKFVIIATDLTSNYFVLAKLVQQKRETKTVLASQLSHSYFSYIFVWALNKSEKIMNINCDVCVSITESRIYWMISKHYLLFYFLMLQRNFYILYFSLYFGYSVATQFVKFVNREFRFALKFSVFMVKYPTRIFKDFGAIIKDFQGFLRPSSRI